MIAATTYPVCFSHVGITVPDLNKAISFFTSAMGWYYVSGPIHVEENGVGGLSEIGKKIYGTGWGAFSFAHLVSADGIGFEMFEFKNNPFQTSQNNPFVTSIHHFCIQDPHIEERVERIVHFGGKQKTGIMPLDPTGVKPYKMVYMEDPFGNLIEIYTHSYIQHNQ